MDSKYFEQYPEAEIDLHGMIRDEALNELAHFLAWAKANDLHYARIITGKGSGSFNQVPVVRNAVLAYLNMEGYHYEFASMFSGGEGAIHVEL
jgi:DNA-nicking Smr family endonuclease